MPGTPNLSGQGPTFPFPLGSGWGEDAVAEFAFASSHWINFPKEGESESPLHPDSLALRPPQAGTVQPGPQLCRSSPTPEPEGRLLCMLLIYFYCSNTSKLHSWSRTSLCWTKREQQDSLPLRTYSLLCRPGRSGVGLCRATD